MAKRMILVASVLGALVAPDAAAQAMAGYEIKPLRWEEDYASLPPGAPSFKRIDFGDDGYLSLGGELRWRAEAYDEPLFGQFAAQDFVSSNTRLLLHGDLRVSSRARVFVQLGAGDERGREPTDRPFDESGLDLAQGFVDLGPEAFRVRVGRQELPFGRFVSLRDSTNLRRTFDGVRLDGAVGPWRWTGFAAAPTRNRPDAFDDDPDPNDRAWGIAVSRDSWTATYFGRNDERARYAAGAGVEERHTLALRTAGARGLWRWDAQGGAQFGALDTQGRSVDIRAFGFASEVSRGLQAPWSPRLALRVDAAGGDDDPKDDRLGTFDLGFPNLSYLSDAAAIAPRNVVDLHPFVTLAPGPALSLAGGVELLWRLERGDAVYAPPFLPLTAAGGPGDAFAAAQWYARATWRPSRHVEVLGSVVRIEPGPAITRAGGEAQTFAALQTSLRY